jgi:hypothetical protein
MKNLVFWMELNTPMKILAFVFHHFKVVSILHFVFHEELNTVLIFCPRVKCVTLKYIWYMLTGRCTGRVVCCSAHMYGVWSRNYGWREVSAKFLSLWSS